MYQGKENLITANKLLDGETCIVVGYGQSMTPILKSGQAVKVVPITADIVLKKDDIVFCKVNGHFYLHKISAIRNNMQYQIANNHGHINGWISKSRIYGKVVEILK